MKHLVEEAAEREQGMLVTAVFHHLLGTKRRIGPDSQFVRLLAKMIRKRALPLRQHIENPVVNPDRIRLAPCQNAEIDIRGIGSFIKPDLMRFQE